MSLNIYMVVQVHILNMNTKGGVCIIKEVQITV